MRVRMANASMLAILTAAALAPDAGAEFCWRQSYGRGVGTLPTNCGPGSVFDAGLCYTACRPGYTGAGPVCQASCPGGWTDHGGACAKPAGYARGAGSPWKFGDRLDERGMMRRCEAANGAGNCELEGAVAYPKCRPRYHKVGCCVCSPDCPGGFGDTGAACTKPAYTRDIGSVPTACDAGLSYEAGLCYTRCAPGNEGVGPVCLNQCPAGFVTCGAGCASSASECARAVTDQIISVMDAAVNIVVTAATAGSGSAARAAVTSAARAVARKATAGVSKASARKAIVELAERAGEPISERSVEALSRMAAGEDFDPYQLDLSGIAHIVKVYDRPVCRRSR